MSKKKLTNPFVLLFGRLQWSSPPWLSGLKNKAKTSPGGFWASLIAILLIVGASIYGWNWYKNQPKPQRVTAVITAPDITPVNENEDEEPVPNDLVMDFGYTGESFQAHAVAPLNMIGKNVTEGIHLSPELPGEWYWQSDSELVFTPGKDWPAGQKYEVTFDKTVFAKDAKMQTYTHSFTTKPFQLKVDSFNYYQDPVNPKNRRGIATVSFNYPVDPASFENHLDLRWQASDADKGAAEQSFKYTVTYDHLKRKAYIQSENIALPDAPRYLLLTIEKGVQAAKGASIIEQDISQNVLIPDAGSYFKVNNVSTSLIRDERDKPDQVLTIETSLGATDQDLKKSVHVYLLPQNFPATANQPEQVNYQWQNPGEINAAILALSTPLTLQAIPSDRNYAQLHSYKFAAPATRYVFVKIDKGMRAFGDFNLNNDYVTVLSVPELPKEISFLHKGALLALSGEQKLSVMVRGLAAVKFSFARVRPDNINQLVTQTGGDFNNPYFINQSFNQQNISEIFSEVQQFDASDLAKQHYSALDFAKYLSAQANTGGPQGLFLLQATGWDVSQQTALDTHASRLVLITDLALIVKDNQDGTHDIFVQSITQGNPVANANVSILGKNGIPLLTRSTDEQGRVSFPNLSDYVDDREPVVYLAALNNDVSFIPYNNSNRQLNMSRFDVGGVYTTSQDPSSLSAYLFSDRGIYRPGDKIHLGMIVKQLFAHNQPAGLPLQITLTDPRGTSVLDRQFALNSSGFVALDIETEPSTATGQYQANLYLVKDNRADSLLGSTTLRVAEFKPDTMRIKAILSQQNELGWISPDDLKAKVELVNLYGAPATNRKVTAKILLTPQKVTFDKYPEYVFVDPLQDPNKQAKVFTDNLADGQTNDEGIAEFNLDLNRFTKATYHLNFFAEGFEAEGGRSVATQTQALVSPLPFFAGYKADGDLKYIRKDGQRSVHFIAVNSKLQTIEVAGLKMQTIALEPVTTLVKMDNGTFQYQSVIKENIVTTQDFAIDAAGSNYALPTQQIGDYALRILDKNNTVLSQFAFSVVGDSQRPMAKNAELSVKLNKEEYNPGDDIELQITAPYTGSGLITIERDKVYVAQWFKTDTNSSVQTIKLPADFEGNGYINVAFTRNWDSPEIFISPLSYSVQAFTVNNENRDMKIHLNVPKLGRPGETLTLEYQTEIPGKIVVFAVDEGILQVANYLTPDPLAFFFQNRALQVLTQQTIDQILPKFIRERELSAVGGDDGEAMLAKHLNPFKRKTDLPVVFWSGIIDTDKTVRQLSYKVPDYFNGSLIVMAVAVGENEVGKAETATTIRGNFIINPNVPNFVAPGDVFEISASVANNVENSGADAQVSVNLNVPPSLEVIGERQQTLTIAEGQEQVLRFQLRATQQLGSATINLVANAAGKSSTMDIALSIRPASSFMTTITSATSKDAATTLSLDRVLYPEYRKVNLGVSSSPLILLAGLQRYLDDFPYGCTEQLTSKALPTLSMIKQPWFSKDRAAIDERVYASVQMLIQRQMSSGAFSYWPGVGDNYSNDFATVYAVNFLTEARQAGFTIPNEMLFPALGYLKEIAGKNNTELEKARIQAYAIYLLTRNEIVTSNYLSNLQLNLEKAKTVGWQQDMTAVYMAATYQMLQNQSEGERLLSAYKMNGSVVAPNDFYNQNIANAQYLYIIAKHFPARLSSVSDTLLMPLVEAMNSDEMNTVLAGYTSLALSSMSDDQTSTITGMTIDKLMDANKEVMDVNSPFMQVPLADGVEKVIINNPDKQTYFYQFTQAGFDQKAPAAFSNGIEVSREYRDLNGTPITACQIGQEIEVHIQLRASNDRYLNNIAIVDLLPGGFEVNRDSVKTDNVEYADVREDRVVFFTTALPQAYEIVYRLRATNSGQFMAPAILAESMYNPAIKAYGEFGHFVVNPNK